MVKQTPNKELGLFHPDLGWCHPNDNREEQQENFLDTRIGKMSTTEQEDNDGML